MAQALTAIIGPFSRRRRQYDLLEASNGSDALELCVHSARRLDLMITDRTMPLMNGIDLIKQASVLKPEMRVILISGRGLEPSELPGMSVLPKPFTIKGLLAKVSDVLSE